MLIAVIVAAGSFLAYSFQEKLQTRVYHESAPQPLSVFRGERLDQVLDDLKQRGVLPDPFLLRLYLKLTNEKLMVQAGTYYFPSPISTLGVLDRLRKGVEYEKLTIIEGWTRFDIAAALSQMPSLKLSPTQALKLLDDPKLIKDLDPKAKNLEGYLYPDTYFVVANATGEELVREMVTRFKDVWDKKLKWPATLRGMSPHNVVTVASIIETESKLNSERPLIASVIQNRLNRHMPLGMDSTVVYASKLAGKWKNNGIVYQSDIKRQSPYNTRIFVGLPPGPVGSPGLNSLYAAVEPTPSKYLYYVRDPNQDNGAHTFYNDAQSFEVGVQALRNWEKKHRP